MRCVALPSEMSTKITVNIELSTALEPESEWLPFAKFCRQQTLIRMNGKGLQHEHPVPLRNFGIVDSVASRCVARFLLVALSRRLLKRRSVTRVLHPGSFSINLGKICDGHSFVFLLAPRRTTPTAFTPQRLRGMLDVG